MTRRAIRFGLVLLAVLVAIAGLSAAAFYQRLAAGPVSLGFVKPVIESMMGAGAQQEFRIGDAIIERDAETGRPHFRLRNVELLDNAGLVIARAPRAAFSLDGWSLLSLKVRPSQLELIGARIMLRRKLDGTLALGFGETLESPDGTLAAPATPAPMSPDDTSTALQDFLKGSFATTSQATASLEGVLITDASIQLFDERNEALWYAPAANLAFKRVAYGFVLLANADIAGAKSPWKAEVFAKYVTASREISVEARIADLVPADLSDKVFALSQLTQVRLPLSGLATFGLNSEGMLTQASASFTAGAGLVGFPGYVAEPVAVDGGQVNLTYEPQSGDINLQNSSLIISGMRAELTGGLEQLRDDKGLLNALRLRFDARNLDAGKSPQAFSSVRLQGLALTRERRFDLEELVLETAAGARASFKGAFAEGAESPGIKLEGSVSAVPSWMVQRLWPPVIAPGTRRWFATHVSAGMISQGTLVMNVPPDALANATKRNVALADDLIDLRFTMQGVATGYLGEMPPITGASGEGRLRGDQLSMMLENGTVTLPSGKLLKLGRANMSVTQLAAIITPARFDVTASGPAQGALELLDYAPLNLAKAAGIRPQDASGDVAARFSVVLPLIQDKPPGKPVVTAEAKLIDAGLKAAFGGISLEAGDVDIKLAETGAMSAQGAVKLNGAPAKVTWSKQPGVEGKETVSLEATFTDAHRKSLGADTQAYASGPIGVKLSAENPRKGLTAAKVELDLSRAVLKLDPIRWSRPATAKTVASFTVDATSPGKVQLRNISVSGGGMNVKGAVVFSPAGDLLEANFPNAVLDPENRMSLSLRKADDGVRVVIKGQQFDARPMINSMFQRRVTPPGEKPVPLRISASFASVIANRGEAFSNVQAEIRTLGSFIQQAQIGGDMSNGTRALISIAPNAAGYRDMNVSSADAGSMLRAANIYSKMAGGRLGFIAELGTGNDAAIRRGVLEVRSFEVRNEAALAEIDARGRVLNKGKLSKDRIAFDRLTVPFSADDQFVRIGDSLVRGPELGASATGTIRKSDGAMDIGGTIIPAYALNSVVGKVPLLGEMLVGGKGQGVFGITFALRGTMSKPRTLFNPVSAIAPGFLRGIFSMGGGGVNPDGTPRQ